MHLILHITSQGTAAAIVHEAIDLGFAVLLVGGGVLFMGLAVRAYRASRREPDTDPTDTGADG